MRIFFSVVISAFLFGCQAQQQEQAAEVNDGAVEVNSETQHKPFSDVDVSEAQKLIASGEVVILDVRTDSEYQSGHIEGAQQLDFFGENFASSLEGLSKDKSYLVYCASGNRSGKAIELMKELEFQEAHNLSGGIKAWRASSLETVE